MKWFQNGTSGSRLISNTVGEEEMVDTWMCALLTGRHKSFVLFWIKSLLDSALLVWCTIIRGFGVWGLFCLFCLFACGVCHLSVGVGWYTDNRLIPWDCQICWSFGVIGRSELSCPVLVQLFSVVVRVDWKSGRTSGKLRWRQLHFWGDAIAPRLQRHFLLFLYVDRFHLTIADNYT